MTTDMLVADSGNTKTDWALIGADGVKRFKTQGINPFHQDAAAISAILSRELLPQMGSADGVGQVRFYGSGVRPELQPAMRQLLAEAFPRADSIEAHGDLLGAAIALCGRREGIACILGTGANSCLYDGRQIVANTPPLGYVLGDEGSGAVLGRTFLRALCRGLLGEAMQAEFEAWSGLTMSGVIDRVYRQPLAARWLASLSPFIAAHTGHDAVQAMVVDNFRNFIRHHVVPYRRPDLPLAATGSIAHHYRRQLETAAHAEGYVVATVLQSPIDGLIRHFQR